jgi:hypothetical protein
LPEVLWVRTRFSPVRTLADETPAPSPTMTSGSLATFSLPESGAGSTSSSGKTSPVLRGTLLAISDVRRKRSPLNSAPSSPLLAGAPCSPLAPRMVLDEQTLPLAPPMVLDEQTDASELSDRQTEHSQNSPQMPPAYLSTTGGGQSQLLKSESADDTPLRVLLEELNAQELRETLTTLANLSRGLADVTTRTVHAAIEQKQKLAAAEEAAPSAGA